MTQRTPAVTARLLFHATRNTYHVVRIACLKVLLLLNELRDRKSMSTDLNNYKTVQTWLQGVHEQSGVSSEADSKRIQVLTEFCARVEKQPDEIIDDCLRDVDGGGKKIRAKGRRFYAEKINEFEQQSDGKPGKNARKQTIFAAF